MLLIRSTNSLYYTSINNHPYTSFSVLLISNSLFFKKSSKYWYNAFGVLSPSPIYMKLMGSLFLFRIKWSISGQIWLFIQLQYLKLSYSSGVSHLNFEILLTGLSMSKIWSRRRETINSAIFSVFGLLKLTKSIDILQDIYIFRDFPYFSKNYILWGPWHIISIQSKINGFNCFFLGMKNCSFTTYNIYCNKCSKHFFAQGYFSRRNWIFSKATFFVWFGKFVDLIWLIASAKIASVIISLLNMDSKSSFWTRWYINLNLWLIVMDFLFKISNEKSHHGSCQLLSNL